MRSSLADTGQGGAWARRPPTWLCLWYNNGRALVLSRLAAIYCSASLCLPACTGSPQGRHTAFALPHRLFGQDTYSIVQGPRVKSPLNKPPFALSGRPSQPQPLYCTAPLTPL
jgi:hypothetical protein